MVEYCKCEKYRCEMIEVGRLQVRTDNEFNISGRYVLEPIEACPIRQGMLLGRMNLKHDGDWLDENTFRRNWAP